MIVGTIASVKGLEANTSNLFRLRVLEMAKRLETNADWLAAAMASETGGTFDPKIRNPRGGATGILQFMPTTASRLGTSVDALAAMTAVEQLAYVEKYFEPVRGRLKTPGDIYVVMFGKQPGKPGDTVAAVAGTLAYDWNAPFDLNKDGTITHDEIGAMIRKVLASAETRPRIDVFAEEGGRGLPGASGGAALFALLALGTVVAFSRRKR